MILSRVMGIWTQPEEKLKQSLENLQQSILEVKSAIIAAEKHLSTIQSQYSQVIKEAKSWKTLKEMSLDQGFDVSTQTAEKQFQEVRQQAILLKTQIKEKEKRLVILRDSWRQASDQLEFLYVTNFEASLINTNLTLDHFIQQPLLTPNSDQEANRPDA